MVDLHHSITGSIRQQFDCDCAGCGWLADDAAGKFEQIDVEPRIAVEQKKPIIETVARMPHRAAGTGALRLDRHLDLQIELRLERGRRRIVDNALCCKPSEQQDPLQAMAGQLEQQHVEKGNSIDRQQRLWRVGRQSAESAPETAAQDHRLSHHSRSSRSHCPS